MENTLSAENIRQLLESNGYFADVEFEVARQLVEPKLSEIVAEFNVAFANEIGLGMVTDITLTNYIWATTSILGSPESVAVLKELVVGYVDTTEKELEKDPKVQAYGILSNHGFSSSIQYRKEDETRTVIGINAVGLIVFDIITKVIQGV